MSHGRRAPDEHEQLARTDLGAAASVLALDMIEAAEIPRSELARRMGTHRSTVTRYLAREQMDLSTLASIAYHCGFEVVLAVRPRDTST